MYVTSCHELSHHIQPRHNREHERAMQTVLEHCMKDCHKYMNIFDS
jgi:DNA-binding transcriptional regulator YdaS (Cro superfamily)